MKKRLTQQLFLMAFLAFFSTALMAQNIVITEIMYNPPESGQDTTEFIELYNATDVEQNLNGWKFSDGVEFTFPTEVMAAGEYLIVAKDDTAFFNTFGFMPLQWTDGGLNNTGERIELTDASGAVIDTVSYLDDWSELTDGGGASLVLCDYSSDNNLGTNWMAASTEVSGLIVNGKQVLANPGAASGCPTSMTLVDDNVSTLKDAPAVFDVLANDVIPNAITSVTVGTPSQGGTATVNADNKIDYTPPAGVCGVVDVFEYTVVSGDETKVATVNVTISCSPTYPIGTVITENADGVADSIGVACTLTGVVYGVDLRGGNGIQFTVIDANGDGIAIYSGSDDYGYTVVEGDEITMQGEVGQYKGLTQFYPVAITKNSSSNALVAPMVVTSLGENTESKLIKLENMHLVDPADWTGSGSGFNVAITNGGPDTLNMRIDNDVNAYGDAAFPANLVNGFHLVGIGSQYDGSSPYTSGYQIFPRYVADFDLISATNTPALQEKISVSPNPTTNDIVVKMELAVDELRLVNVMGQTIYHNSTPNATQTISLANAPVGLYFLQVTVGDAFTTFKIEKN